MVVKYRQKHRPLQDQRVDLSLCKVKKHPFKSKMTICTALYCNISPYLNKDGDHLPVAQKFIFYITSTVDYNIFMKGTHNF